MKELTVDLGKNSYNIAFCADFDMLCQKLREINAPKKLHIVTDTNVGELYLDEVLKILSLGGYDVSSFTFAAGERSKNISTIEDICASMMDAGLDRSSMVIALGGGVVGDMAGFAAGIYMRGIRFVQIPTTLLSQSDSSVGGKTGVDFLGAKNILGVFLQPKLVYINVSTLLTLPEREFISGMGEVIKHGVIGDTELFSKVEKNINDIKALRAESLIELVYSNCRVKAGVVSEDEKEAGLRRVLNFGHTIGHAIESECNFTKTHGECVALGMICVGKIAADRGFFSENEKLINVIRLYGFDLDISGCDIEHIAALVKLDKKKKGDKVTFVLPKSIGSTEFYSDITDEEIKASLRYLKEI